MLDAHRHDEYSLFDGFGKPIELAAMAKEKGYSALGITNHGNTTSLVKHYGACREFGIKPILGVEGYFLPVQKPNNRGYHLCLYAKDVIGYKNLNEIQTAGDKIKYYNPIWTFDFLERHHEGVVCSSGCIASFLSQAIAKKNKEQAEKFLGKMVDVFGDDFYIEIQPYRLSEEGLQEYVNDVSMRLAKKHGIKCILTSDSHFGDATDFDTYLKMHEIGKHSMELDAIRATYSERYMPTEKEIEDRFFEMFPTRFAEAWAMQDNLDDFESKFDPEIFEHFEQKLPTFMPGKDSNDMLKSEVIAGLRSLGKMEPAYIERAKEELKIVRSHDFSDYFLIVSDYVRYAKNNGIVVGLGRGSGCNSLLNYALGITAVDPVLFGLDFERFLRYDKKKMPDVDVDFEPSRRDEVISYILSKYVGKTAQIKSYGLYKVDNLINDLAKVCGMKDDKNEIARVKSLVNSYKNDEGEVDVEALKKDRESAILNKSYEGIIKHFSKLYNKVRFIGTHAAGVEISDFPVSTFSCVSTEAKTGKQFVAYDLSDTESIGAVKLDVLGLNVLNAVRELRELTGVSFSEEWTRDKGVIDLFAAGRTDGIFQFEKKSVQDMLRSFHVDCFADIVAANSLNRPGPLSLKMHDEYASNKATGNIDAGLAYFKYVKETHGCLIYQEQVQQICVHVGGLSWEEADKIIKTPRSTTKTGESAQRELQDALLPKFQQGALKHGVSKSQSADLFNMFFNYTFNKGHATGYSMISVEEAYYKVYHPTEFWYVKIKYAPDDTKLWKYKANAVKEGCVLMLPHVNYGALTTLKTIDGELVIAEGLSGIKGIGPKAAEFIERERVENGLFRSVGDFENRCKNRAVTSKVVSLLKDYGCLNFVHKDYIARTIKYNADLYGRSYRV